VISIVLSTTRTLKPVCRVKGEVDQFDQFKQIIFQCSIALSETPLKSTRTSANAACSIALLGVDSQLVQRSNSQLNSGNDREDWNLRSFEKEKQLQQSLDGNHASNITTGENGFLSNNQNVASKQRRWGKDDQFKLTGISHSTASAPLIQPQDRVMRSILAVSRLRINSQSGQQMADCAPGSMSPERKHQSDPSFKLQASNRQQLQTASPSDWKQQHRHPRRPNMAKKNDLDSSGSMIHVMQHTSAQMSLMVVINAPPLDEHITKRLAR